MRTRVAVAAGVVVVAAAVALAVALTRPHAQAAPKDDPRAFAENVVRLIAGNRYAEAWETLNPVDQRVAPRAEYVGCEQRTPIAAKVREIRAVGVSDDSVGLGDGKFIRSTAVAVRIAFAGDASFVVTHSVHLVAVGERWTWVLPSWRYRSFKANHCPVAPSAPTSGA
jgi:hypothetical protein